MTTTGSQLEMIDSRIAALTKRLETLTRLREAMVQDPDLLSALMPAGATSGPRPTPQSETGATSTPPLPAQRLIRGGAVAKENFDKIVQSLISSGNEPKSLGEIAHETGLKYAAVVQVTYRTHAALFEKIESATHRIQMWKLKNNWRDLLKSAGISPAF